MVVRPILSRLVLPLRVSLEFFRPHGHSPYTFATCPSLARVPRVPPTSYRFPSSATSFAPRVPPAVPLSQRTCLCAIQGYLRSFIVSPPPRLLSSDLPMWAVLSSCLCRTLVSTRVLRIIEFAVSSVHSNVDGLNDSNLEPESIPRGKHKATGRITCWD
jgi:hypothetical protein